MHNDDDMIERFLEGQTSNEENEALFSALASDSSLQAEFRTSVGIRRTFEYEAATIKAPPAVLDSLMASATASGLIPASAPATGSISGGLIKLFILLGAMIIGAALYPLLFRNDASTQQQIATTQTIDTPSMHRSTDIAPGAPASNNDDQPQGPAVHDATTSHMAPGTETTVDGPSAPSSTTVRIGGTSHRRSSARTTSSREHSRQARPTISSRRLVLEQIVPHLTLDELVTPDGTIILSDEMPEDMAAVDNASIAISPSTPIATFQSTAPVVASQNATAEPIELAGTEDASTDRFSRFEFRFHSQALGRQIGGSIDGVSPMANFGGELGYRFDDISSAGLGFYHVVIPQDTAIFMRWWGAYYRATPDIGLPFQLRPYFQATIGGCERGVVMAPSIGLTMPVGMFSLSLGADVTALAQNAGNGVVAFTVRPAMRFAVGITF